MTVVHQAPDSKADPRLRAGDKKTQHIYHKCQRGLPVATALCGHQRPKVDMSTRVPRDLPPEACVVCADLHPVCARCESR